MKKIKIVTLIFVAALAVGMLAACSGGNSSTDSQTDVVTEVQEEVPSNGLIGTWIIDHAKIDGSNYTIAEIAAMYKDDPDLAEFTDSYMIFKDGGSVYFYSGMDEFGLTVEWSQDGDTVTIGAMECKLEDGYIVLEMASNLYFAKVSDNQTIDDSFVAHPELAD